jgi:hypothetical protein
MISVHPAGHDMEDRAEEFVEKFGFSVTNTGASEFGLVHAILNDAKAVAEHRADQEPDPGKQLTQTHRNIMSQLLNYHKTKTRTILSA